MNLDIGTNLTTNTLQQHGYIGGATGTGKSVTIMKIVEELVKKTNAVTIVFDSKGDLGQLGYLRKHTETVLLHEMTDNWDENSNYGLHMKMYLGSIDIEDFISIADLNENQSNILKAMRSVQKFEWGDYVNFFELVEYIKYYKDEIKEIYDFDTRSYNALITKVLGLHFDYGKFFYTVDEVNFFNPLDKRYFKTVNEFKDQHLLFIVNVSAICQNATLYQLFTSFIISSIKENYKKETSELKLSLFIDEAHLLFNGGSQKLVDNIETLTRVIRSKGVALWFISQGFAEIPKAINTNLNTVIQHRLNGADPDSLRQLAKMFANMNSAKGIENTVKHYEGMILSLNRGEAFIKKIDEDHTIPVIEKHNIIAPDCLGHKINNNIHKQYHCDIAKDMKFN